jgi:NADH-quinone oxidoreductase subunit B
LLAIDTGRGYTLFVLDAGLACCAVECAAALRRLGPPEAADRPGPGAAGRGAARQGVAGVLIVAGTVTDKLAPLVLRAYQGMPEPRYVMSFGACSNSGGPYWDSYCVTKGVDQFLPVDVYVPGCPPRPEALLDGLGVLETRGLAGQAQGVAGETGRLAGEER